MVLHGIASALFAYCVSLVVSSPLAAFAAAAGYQFIAFLVRMATVLLRLPLMCLLMLQLYMCGYLLVLTYGKTSEAHKQISLIHWTVSILAPVNSLVRTALQL